MRLDRLDLTRYGKFTDVTLDFGRPKAGSQRRPFALVGPVKQHDQVLLVAPAFQQFASTVAAAIVDKYDLTGHATLADLAHERLQRRDFVVYGDHDRESKTLGKAKDAQLPTDVLAKHLLEPIDLLVTELGVRHDIIAHLSKLNVRSRLMA